MEIMREAVFCLGILFLFWVSAAGLLSPKGVNFEAQALMGIKASLKDPHNVLEDWDGNSVDPCRWSMITCSSDGVIGLLFQNNSISGPIPPELGKLSRLQTLDLSNNFFNGEIPSSLNHLISLEYLRLNNNNLSGPFPVAVANMSNLTFLDLSFNNLSGPVPRLPAKTINIVGNPLICRTGAEQDCLGTIPIHLSPIDSGASRSGHGILSTICFLVETVIRSKF